MKLFAVNSVVILFHGPSDTVVTRYVYFVGGSSSSTPVSLRSSSAEKKMSHQEPQTYSTSSPQQVCYWTHIYILSLIWVKDVLGVRQHLFFYFILQSWFCDGAVKVTKGYFLLYCFMLIVGWIGWSVLICLLTKMLF